MDRRDAARMSERTPIALTIAGSDSGGGAGIQADLKTFAALGVYGATVVTAVTAQNTKGVRAVHNQPAEIVRAQIEAVMEDFAVAAIKIGMLGNAEIVEAVAAALPSPQPSPAGRGGADLPLLGEGGPRDRARVVFDPVMAASSGESLSGAGFVEAVRSKLLPLVDCLTPNLDEAAALLEAPAALSEADMARQGEALLRLGPRAVLMKGGHLGGDEAADLLMTADGVRRFAAPRIASKNLHGTGCTLSSAVAAFLVRGEEIEAAARLAKAFVRAAIERGRLLTLGAGVGPLIQTNLFLRH